MVADQAAGLRRRSGIIAGRRLHLVSSSTAPARLLIQALDRQGLRALMIDAEGRHFANWPRSLFDWRQQLASGRLQIAPIPGGEGWLAPGAEAGAPGLAALGSRYAWLVFDRAPPGAGALEYLEATDLLVLDVATHALEPAYRLLKTLAQAKHVVPVVLLGDAEACNRLESACARFLGMTFAQKIGNLGGETDAIGALAGRMAGEERRPRVVA